MLYIQIKTKRLRHLLTTAKTKDEVKSALLLDVVIRKSTTILQLLSSENETLLVRRDALLILNLRLDVVNGVGRLHLEGDRLTSQSLDEDLHTTTETQDYITNVNVYYKCADMVTICVPRWSVDSFWML